MRFNTSKTIVIFASITGACALLGGVAQVSQNLGSSRLETVRQNRMRIVAGEVLSAKCRRSDGGVFQRGQTIPEPKGMSPTSCASNELGERAFVAYKNGKLTVQEVYSAKEIKSKISQIKEENK